MRLWHHGPVGFVTGWEMEGLTGGAEAPSQLEGEAVGRARSRDDGRAQRGDGDADALWRVLLVAGCGLRWMVGGCAMRPPRRLAQHGG